MNSTLSQSTMDNYGDPDDDYSNEDDTMEYNGDENEDDDQYEDLDEDNSQEEADQSEKDDCNDSTNDTSNNESTSLRDKPLKLHNVKHVNDPKTEALIAASLAANRTGRANFKNKPLQIKLSRPGRIGDYL